MNAHPGTGGPAAPPASGTLRFPCTALQAEAWRKQIAEPDSSAGNVALRWRLLGAVRDQCVELALQTLLDRHEILRTAFEAKAGEPEQVIRPARIKLASFDLTRLSTADKAAQAERIAESDGRKPFRLDEAPLLRATLVRLAAEEAILLLTFHRCVADGWSVGVAARELAMLIDGLERRAPVELPEPELQFGDYALWRRATLEGETLAKERAYWRRRLRDAPETLLPPTAAPGAEGGDTGRICSLLLDEAFTARLAGAVEREGRTAFAFALACLARVVSRAAGAGDILMGTQVACREDELLFGLVGPVVNTVPLRLNLAEGADWRELLGHCQTAASEAFDHQALPFTEIAALAGRMPLNIGINFAYQPANIDTNDIGSIRSGGIELVSLPSVSTGALYDLGFFMVRRREGWRLSCEFATARHDDAEVRRLLDEWRVELESMTTAAWEEPPAPAGPAAVALRPVAPPREPTRLYFDLLAMQPDGALPPVFAFNNRSAYYPIARWFGTSRPFVDIQWREDAAPPPLSPESIPDIAAHAAKLVRSFDPVGPYYFMGHCAMGYVVFETARQLRASGAEVGMIFLLDTLAPGYIEGMRRHDRMLRRIQLLGHSWRHFLELAHDVRSGGMSLRAALMHYGFLRNNPLMRLARRRGLAALSPAAGDDLMNHGLMNYLQDARRLYRIEPYDGDVTFFRSAEALTGRLFGRGFGWERIVTGSFAVYDVPGAHLHMTREPGAGVIAATAAWLMDRKEGRWRLPGQGA